MNSVQAINCPSRLHNAVILSLLVAHSLLLAIGGWCHSPSWDEIGHLPSGVVHLRTGTFQLYHVNPPLVRMVAAIPVVCAGADESWLGSASQPTFRRGEWDAGRNFIKANGEQTFTYFTLARWACIPFSLLGAIVCYMWARDLYGSLAGLFAMALWCVSPNILAHGQMITPDVGATSLGVAAFYSFWHWLRVPTRGLALTTGLLLGLMLLTKATWIIAIPLWPVIFITYGFVNPYVRTRYREWKRRGGGMLAILLVSLYVLNLGYAFEETGVKLGDFPFVSQSLGGDLGDDLHLDAPGNRFKNSFLASLPVPLPANYVLGIDRQKLDFERGYWSYLRGEWRHAGWWYYYLYALTIKVPIGTWVIFGTAALMTVWDRRYNAPFGAELFVLLPAILILSLVSSQTGFNHHLRYVLPVFPFCFIWISKVIRSIQLRQRIVSGFVIASLLWSTASSLYYFPHNLSYFNEFVGGPRHGHDHLLDSNIDWGQDLLLLKWWMNHQTDKVPTFIAYSLPEGLVDPVDVGIDSAGLPPVGPAAATAADTSVGPMPGRYAIFVRALRERDRKYEYFLNFEPTELVGYSVYIYNISLEDANRVRKQLGLETLAPHSPLDRPLKSGSVSEVLSNAVMEKATI